MKKYKSTDAAKLKRKLEGIFNLWIRLRDCADGWGVCISCGKPTPFEKMQAGHFWSKGGHPAVRFDPRNVHGQESSCNVFKRGNLLEYQKGLIKKIGQEEYNSLEQDRNLPKKYTTFDLLELIELYQAKVKELS